MTFEIQALAGVNEYINIVPHSQRKYASWIGGSMYASLNTFSHIQITKQEYEEADNVVHKKFIS